MVNYSSLLATIIYDPLAWIDESYFDVRRFRLSAGERRLINEIVINSLNFKPLLLEELNQFEKEMVTFWLSLPRVFTLMAYFRYRALLLSSPNRHQLDSKAVQVALSLRTDSLVSRVFKCDMKTNITPPLLQTQAYREMMSFSDYLSESIRQRLCFLFPASVQGAPNHVYSQHADFLLLRILCHYVKSEHSL